jgi:plasmid stabilization system protein ParE
MAEVVFRDRARRDLDQIDARIAADDPGAAERFRANVLRRIGLLERLPEGAQPRPEFGPDIRTIPIGSYIVILRVVVPKVTVLIVHSARDLPRLLKSRS